MSNTTPSETEKLRSALEAAVETIQDYLAYSHDGDPWKEDSRAMGEMDINDYGRDGRLDYALSLLAEPAADTPAPQTHSRGDIIKAMAQAMADADGPDGPSYEHLAHSALRAIKANGLISGEVHEALMDSQYVAGAKAGWNAAQLPDVEANEKIAQLMRLELGTLAALKSATQPQPRDAGISPLSPFKAKEE